MTHGLRDNSRGFPHEGLSGLGVRIQVDYGIFFPPGLAVGPPFRVSALGFRQDVIAVGHDCPDTAIVTRLRRDVSNPGEPVVGVIPVTEVGEPGAGVVLRYSFAGLSTLEIVSVTS